METAIQDKAQKDMKKETDAVIAAFKEKVKVIFQNKEIQDMLEYLFCRWLDESEHEDFADYANQIENALKSHDVEFVKATRRPFGFHIRFREVARPSPSTSRPYFAIYKFTMTTREYKVAPVRWGRGRG